MEIQKKINLCDSIQIKVFRFSFRDVFKAKCINKVVEA